MCICWASLLAQTVKHRPAMQETWVPSLDREDPLEEGVASYSSILAWRILANSLWGGNELDTTEQLSGEGNGNPLQRSCLERIRDGHRLKRLSMHACTGEGNGNPLHCSCLENPRDRGAWWAAVYGAAQSRTWLKRLSSSSRATKQAQCVSVSPRLLIYLPLPSPCSPW